MFYDNDGNGQIDDSQERYSGSAENYFQPNWQFNLEENNIIVFNGRNSLYINGEINPWYVSEGDKHIRGDHYYDESLVKLMFDVFLYDWGEDGIPGDLEFEDQEL